MYLHRMSQRTKNVSQDKHICVVCILFFTKISDLRKLQVWSNELILVFSHANFLPVNPEESILARLFVGRGYHAVGVTTLDTCLLATWITFVLVGAQGATRVIWK